MTIPPSPDDPKPALRQLYRERRRAFVATLSPATREALEGALADRFAPLVPLARAPASYAAIGPEIDPRFVEHRLGPHAFPRVTGDSLRFHRATWAELRPGFGGIPEPPASAPEVTPGLVLVPLLAATLAGTRLGQGGGFYDRALAALRGRGRVIAVGLAFDVQVADMLPADPWDASLDWIATPTRLVECAGFR